MLKNLVAGCVVGVVLSSSAWAACDPARNPIPASRYEMKGAEVLDKETGLTWQRCSLGQTWQEGQGCAGSVQELNWRDAVKQGRSGWRLPTREELETLVSKACSPSISPEAFPNVDPIKLWYWSSTQTDRDLAWLVQFGGGATFNGYQTSQNAVRLVRGGNGKG
jgi:hypothetical protein